jgi:hypothetical protein
MLRRLAATALTAAVGASAAAVGASAATVVHRGQIARISLATDVSSQAACSAQIVYADGFLQQTGVKSVVGGRVTFAIRIPRHVAFGPARWSLRCGLTLARSGTWRVAR